ncbi:MAG: formylglycine-generating enzyme family protein [Kiritimatiellae bacterium]|nr:formylglycine-generating enzyme family protein [Kiritimatiellia bacterium]
MKTNKILTLASIASACVFADATAPVVPTVSNVSIDQDRSRNVTITYTLANGPAVVTFDIQTNYVDGAETKWVSIGGRNISHYSGGNCLVTGEGVHTITWHAEKSWPDKKIAAGGVRAELTAWAPDNTPDYMVVDPAEQSNSRVRYYASTTDLPGGLLENEAYRTTHLVMKRIHAKGKSFTMGSYFEGGRTPSTEMTHTVTLTNDYYLGVFELTQGQWAMIKGTDISAKFTHPQQRQLRPMENISYCMMRLAANNTEDLGYWYPNAPHPESFLGILRSRSGIDFDLPSEAQWEFAGRAGQGEGKYGNGAVYEYINMRPSEGSMPPGRYIYTWADPSAEISSDAQMAATSPENGTAVCGSYPPNAFGLYDMHGNVYDFCLDWYKADITALGGAVNVEDGDVYAAPGKDYDGKRAIVRKGGNWGQSSTSMLRASDRQCDPSTGRAVYNGFRLKCTAGLK